MMTTRETRKIIVTTNSLLPQAVHKQSEDIPVISMWRPWANWVSLEWKTIESRTHSRFALLAGKRIGIHASLYWDKDWLSHAAQFLSSAQITATRNFLNVGGAVICTAYVSEHRKLTAEDSQAALIECAYTPRHGLVLRDVERIECVPMKGRQGIWRVPAMTFSATERGKRDEKRNYQTDKEAT